MKHVNHSPQAALIFTLSLALFTTQAALAQDDSNSTRSKKAKAAAAAAATSGKKKTVGDLLQQADRGGQLGTVAKDRLTVPLLGPVVPVKKLQPEELAQIKPPRTSTFMENGADDRAKLENYLDQQIAELFKLVKKFGTSSRRGELWLRLAELYVEKSDLTDNRVQAKYDEELRAFQAGKGAKPKLDNSEARNYNKKAIQLYEWFMRDFPNDARIDQALFFLGYNYFEMNNIKLGLEYYARLTTRFPNSPFITESHFALAEYYFENEKWKEAVKHYYEVAKHPRHRLANFSMYKLAWCEFRSGDTKTAVLTLERLIARNRQADPNTNEGKKISKQRLEKESLRDLVLFFADDRKPEGAIPYFENIAGNEAPYYLEKLAYLYVDRGNREGSRQIFTYLIEKNPNSPKAFDFKYQLTQVYANTPQTKSYREQLYGWVHDYGPANNWYKANQANTTLIENSNRLRETTLKTWILNQHQTAQNTRSPFSQSLAYEGYKVYMNEFPSPTQPGVADMHFFFGELLYDMDKFEEASQQYQWVVDNAPKSKYGTKSAENIILSLEKNLPKDAEISALVGTSVEPVAMQPKTANFIKAAKWFTEKFPTAPRTPELKFKVGRLYYQHNQFDLAIPMFKEIVRQYPTTKYAEYSANLLLDSYNLKKDYAGLEKTGQELLAVQSISQSAAGSDIRNVVEKAQFKRAQDLELAKDYKKSAEQYEAFAAQNPTSNLAFVALFNSAINYERAGENGKAIQQHKAVLASTSKDATGSKPKSRRLIAKLYQESGLLAEAAHAFKEAAVEAGKDPIAANLYYDAAINYELLNLNQSAVTNYEAFQAKSKGADRSDAYFKIGQIYKREGKHKAAAEMFKTYCGQTAMSEKWIEAAYWIYEYSSGPDKAHWRQRVLGNAKEGMGLNWAAKIELLAAQEQFAEFKAFRIPTDPAKQAQGVQKKISLLTALNKELAKVVKMNSPDEIVSALYLSGKASEVMGDSLVKAPIPRGLKPDEEKAYREGVQKVADPFYGKAKESYQSAVDKAFDLEVYGQDLEMAKKALGALDPKAQQDRAEVAKEDSANSWLVNP